MTAFVDFLHRDEFSLKHALGNSKKALPILKERKQTHFAVSNYGEISNWVQQLFTCKENGIVPILGMETFVNNYRKEQKEDGQFEVTNLFTGKVSSVKELSETERDMVTLDWPLDLFARTTEGYYNIIKIHNHAQLTGTEKRPRTSDTFLKDHGKGIVAILQTPFSEVGSLIFNGMEKEALEKYEFYSNLFDEVILSVSIVEEKEYSEIAEATLSFAEKHGIKVIPVIHSHFLKKEEEKAWRTVLKLSKMRSGAFTYEIDDVPGLFYKSKEEVEQVWENFFHTEYFSRQKWEEILSNLDELIFSFSLLELDYDLKLPKFENGPEKLKEKARTGFKAKGYDKLGPIYEERLEYELENIIGAGFADYFLVLEEMFHWYKEELHSIIAFGRGSAAGSLVLNCIGCTNVDPIKHHLLFERFLDAERFKMIVQAGGKVSGADCPDVDSDVATNKRDLVKEHLVERYGKECIASIGTIGTMGTKSTLKDLARLFEVPMEDINEVTAREMKDFKDDDEDPKTIEDLREMFPKLDALLNTYPDMASTFEQLRGSITNWGTHAGGVLITDISLFDNLPVRLDKEGRVVTTWQEGIAGRELGQMGFIKFDILAIDQLNVIEDILKLIEEEKGEEIEIDDIPLDDFKALSLMNKGDGLCIFQFDTELAGKVTKHMSGIRQFEDLGSLSTLMRPAALQNGFDRAFGKLRDSDEEVYMPECLKPFLKETYGLPIYQEHIMQSAMAMAGFDKPTAYKFMKLIYKGKLHTQEEKDYWRDKFIKGCMPKVLHNATEITLENGEKRIVEDWEELECEDGKKRKLKEILELGIGIK